MNRIAAIDIGTNTVRLLVADPDGAPVERALEITRLGQGVDSSGALTHEAMERTIAVVALYARRSVESGADVVRVAGTSALRDAANSDAFAAAVRAATGLELEILSGEREGMLSYSGATSWLAPGTYAVCDIGGGSTELITEQTARSADVGSVRVRERFLVSDPPRPQEVAAARAFVRGEIEAAGRNAGVTGAEALVGVAGTITTLAALVLELERYDAELVHASRLNAADVESWSERLLRMKVEEIRGLPSMHPGRADVIGAGVVILREVVDVFGFEEVLVSERDILDGLVLTAGGRRS